MATFAYTGRTRAGQTVTGERMADSIDGAVAALRREQILVTQINPVKEAAKAAGPKKPKGKSVSAKNLAVFTRQFSVMIDAGLPLVQCLEILGTQEEDKNFSAVILATRTDVESGASLADAMKRHPKAFDGLYTNMVAAGEAGGILDTILKRLATYIEKSVKLKSQVKSAMVYPVAVIVIAALVVGVLRDQAPLTRPLEKGAARGPKETPSIRLVPGSKRKRFSPSPSREKPVCRPLVVFVVLSHHTTR